MATANDLATAVNTYVTAAKDEAITRIKSLNAVASGYAGSTTPKTVFEMAIPIISKSLIQSDAGKKNSASSTKFTSGLDATDSRITSGTALIENIGAPADISFDVDPLAGWAGVDSAISQPWDSATALKTELWDGQGLQAAYDIMQQEFALELKDFDGPLYARSQIIFGVLRTAARVSTNSRLQAAQTTEINLMESHEQTDLARTISTMLESHARATYVQAVTAGVELDKINKMFSLKYGEIYAKLTDALVGKANREVDWFTKDFLARAEMMSKSAEVNNAIYIETIKSAIDTLVKDVETNIRVHTTNFEMSLNEELERFKFTRLDKNHELSISELDVSLFKARLGDMALENSEYLENFTNFHTLEVQAYMALARGYSGLLSTASQGTLAVATSKG